VNQYSVLNYKYQINFGAKINAYYGGFDGNSVWQFSNLTSNFVVEAGVIWFNTNVVGIASQSGDFTANVINSPVRLIYVP
jgi:hypothetical protein